MPANKLPRGKCGYCRKTFALTKKGKLRIHKQETATMGSVTCAGSHHAPLPKE